ncbi:hypothetical protein CBM2604_B40071 [Cupriavidus taiwanensis]|nr:hypothetical protein CBM2604_B40071 [Cupriavidus taiwanensis]SOZ47971.1 hypothetical protein CBM2610_B30070 [Cupriavidus taiwanensis]
MTGRLASGTARLRRRTLAGKRSGSSPAPCLGTNPAPIKQGHSSRVARVMSSVPASAGRYSTSPLSVSPTCASRS